MTLSRTTRLRLLHGWGFRQGDLDLYGFSDGRDPADAEGYLGYAWYLRHVRPALNPPQARPLTENKWIFYRFAASIGIPVPPTLGLFDAVQGTSWDGERPLRTVEQVLEELAARRPTGLVLKPVGGGQGRDVLILDDVDHDSGRALTRTGERTALADVLRGLDLAGMRGYSGYVVQEPVANHADLRRVAPSTTNTIRVQTMVTDDGAAHVQAAIARFGREGGMADNWRHGGVNVAVDVEDGTMGRGLLRGAQERLTAHPDTGVAFTGAVVPAWAETLEVCRRAARLMPGLRSIGWDVVVTPEGPVVLEGNALWGLTMVQVHSDGFLADPAIRAQLEGAGVPLPTGSVVRRLPGRARDGIRAKLARWAS